MPNFKERRQLARMLNRNSELLGDLLVPANGWIHAMRHALGMSVEQVSARKGVSRGAVYQAERSEKEGAISIKQMESVARAMGGTFVYAIVPDDRIEALMYNQARLNALELLQADVGYQQMSADDRHDWIADTIAEQLHDMPANFWDAVSKVTLAI